MADGSEYSSGQLEKFLAFVQGAAIASMRELAPHYNLNPEKLDLKWDNRLGDDVWKYEIRDGRGTLIFGMSAIDKNFKYTLHHALDVLGKTPSHHVVDFTSIQTNESRNTRINERFESLHEGKKLLKPSEYETHTFTSVMMVHKKSGQSVMVSGEGLAAFNLQTEAYMLLCKKVLDI